MENLVLNNPIKGIFLCEAYAVEILNKFYLCMGYKSPGTSSWVLSH